MLKSWRKTSSSWPLATWLVMMLSKRSTNQAQASVLPKSRRKLKSDGGVRRCDQPILVLVEQLGADPHPLRLAPQHRLHVMIQSPLERRPHTFGEALRVREPVPHTIAPILGPTVGQPARNGIPPGVHPPMCVEATVVPGGPPPGIGIDGGELFRLVGEEAQAAGGGNDGCGRTSPEARQVVVDHPSPPLVLGQQPAVGAPRHEDDEWRAHLLARLQGGVQQQGVGDVPVAGHQRVGRRHARLGAQAFVLVDQQLGGPLPWPSDGGHDPPVAPGDIEIGPRAVRRSTAHGGREAASCPVPAATSAAHSHRLAGRCR